MFIELLAILTNKAQAESLTNQMTDNSMDLRIRQKYASDEISQINEKYDAEKDLVRNELANTDNMSAEFDLLMAELNDIEENRDREVKAVEEEINDYETHIQLENDGISTRKQACEANIESFEQALDDNIKDTFGYFQ